MRDLALTARFCKECTGLPRSLQREIDELAVILCRDPLDASLDIKKLQAVAGNLYRVRLGEWRVIYSFTKKTVLLRGVAHRSDVYRFL